MNCTSVTNFSSSEPWFHDEGWNWFMWKIFVWLFPLMCLLGAIANICSFIVIATNRKSFPYVTRQYLLIITMSDFFILTVKAFTHYVGYLTCWVKQSNWSWYSTPRSWGLGWCIVYDFLTYYSAVGSPFFQLGLTVDRLVAVAAPMRAKMILSHKRSWILLAIISGMALLLPIMFAANQTWDYESNFCAFRSKEFDANVYQPVELYYGRVFLITLLMLGTIAICLLLGGSNRAAERMQAEASGTTASSNRQSSRERRKSLVRISLMLVFINVIFFITSLPWSIGAVLATSDLMNNSIGSSYYELVMRHFNSLAYANNAFSWPVYFIGSNFRRAFWQTFNYNRKG